MVEGIIEEGRPIEHLQELLRVAVNCLIDINRPLTIEQRLFQVHLTLILTRSDEFPEQLQEDFEWLMNELEIANPDHVSEEVFPALRPLEEVTARLLVEKVLDLFTHITRIEGIQAYQYDERSASRSTKR